MPKPGVAPRKEKRLDNRQKPKPKKTTFRKSKGGLREGKFDIVVVACCGATDIPTLGLLSLPKRETDTSRKLGEGGHSSLWMYPPTLLI